MKAVQQGDGSYRIYENREYVRGSLTRYEAEYWLEGWAHALEDRYGIGPEFEILDNTNEQS